MADGFLNTIATPQVTGPDIAGQFSKNYLAQTSADLQKAEAADIRDKMITRNRLMAMQQAEINKFNSFDTAIPVADQLANSIKLPQGQKPQPQAPPPQNMAVAQQTQDVAAKKQRNLTMLASLSDGLMNPKSPEAFDDAADKMGNPEVMRILQETTGFIPGTEKKNKGFVKIGNTEVFQGEISAQFHLNAQYAKKFNMAEGTKVERSWVNGKEQALKVVPILTKEDVQSDRTILNVAQNDKDPERKAAATSLYDKMQKDKEALMSNRIPAYQTVADMPNMRFNRKTGGFEMAPSPNSPERQAEIRGATKSLYNSRKMYDMTMQAERQAERNIKIVQDVSNKYIRSRFPLPNKFWAAVRTGTGDPIMGEVQVKLLAASREYMRVVTGGARSAAELSIAAQTKADEIMNNSDSWEVVNAKTSAMIQELKATEKSFKDQMQEQQDVISGKVAPDTQEPKKETRETKTINGKPYYKVGDKWDAD